MSPFLWNTSYPHLTENRQENSPLVQRVPTARQGKLENEHGITEHQMTERRVTELEISERWVTERGISERGIKDRRVMGRRVTGIAPFSLGRQRPWQQEVPTASASHSRSGLQKQARSATPAEREYVSPRVPEFHW